MIDIFPAESDDRAVRIELFDNEIERLSLFDPLTGTSFGAVPRFTVYPKTHYVTPRERILDAIEKIVRKSLRPGVHHFPEDYVTDRSQRFMASEIIREKLIRFMGEELPYSVTVEIEQFKVNERGTYEINGLILVERDGQKKIVIGRKGEKLKKIGTEARLDMERLFDNKVHLELWVKVKSGWADDERALRSLGYMED